jgi:hypothetical protein
MIDPDGPLGARKTARLQEALRTWRAVALSALVLAAALGVADLILLGILRGPGTRPGDPRLVGTWQCDREATLAKIRSTRRIDGEALKTLEGIYGKVRVTYTETTYTAFLEDYVEKGAYDVVGRNDNSVVIKGYCQLTERYEFSRIVFVDDDTFWIYPRDLDLPECFRRVK